MIDGRLGPAADFDQVLDDRIGGRLVANFVQHGPHGLQEGIDAAYSIVQPPPGSGEPGYCEVWVAQGDYHAYVGDETDTIRLRPGVHVFGGFDGGNPPADYGWEISRDDRDWEFNVTRILGTQENDPFPPEEHVQHVVTGAARSTLDGFHVAGGDSEGGAGLPRFGGGMLNFGVSPRVRNCTTRILS